MGPEPLAQVLRPLSEMFLAKEYPDLLVGLEVSDDAAVYRVSDELAIILTLDFFAPVVDDPYDYGAIAAANAMSDVYAMGGDVTLALNICGFPIDLPSEMVSEILAGGAEKIAEAGGALVGGHTVIDKEPKYGLAVVGFVHPDHIATKAGAKAGDVLILTKPLGMGIIATALKMGMAKPDHVQAAVEVMKMLNRKAARLMQQVGIDAVADITGFALLGHAQEMAEKSGVGMHLDLESLPFLEGAKEHAKRQIFPAGAGRNQRYYALHVRFAPSIPEWMQMLLYTPETSGGLLIAVPESKLEELTALFDREGQSHWIIGHIVDGEGIEVGQRCSGGPGGIAALPGMKPDLKENWRWESA
jgi:selenide,water dikinase